MVPGGSRWFRVVLPVETQHISTGGNPQNSQNSQNFEGSCGRDMHVEIYV